MGRAISWEWGCEREAPAGRPWFRKSKRYLKRSSRSRSLYLSRYIQSTAASSSGFIWAGCRPWSGVSTMTSCAPTPPMPSNMPSVTSAVDPSILNAGYLLGTTLICHPGAFGAVPGRRIAAISGGVWDSRPSQNGHVSEVSGSGGGAGKSVGRAARSVAMMTHLRVIASLRSSGTEGPPWDPCRPARYR